MGAIRRLSNPQQRLEKPAQGLLAAQPLAAALPSACAQAVLLLVELALLEELTQPLPAPGQAVLLLVQSTALDQLVDTLRGRLGATNGAPPGGESPEEWAKRLTAWAAGHPRRAVEIDDSRESIYGGRGE